MICCCYLFFVDILEKTSLKAPSEGVQLKILYCKGTPIRQKTFSIWQTRCGLTIVNFSSAFCKAKRQKKCTQMSLDDELIEAVKRNDLNSVDRLLTKGANPNARVCFDLFGMEHCALMANR
jgi:hypothetical protein